MGWDRHKLLWDGTDKYVPWTTLGIWLKADNFERFVSEYLTSTRNYANLVTATKHTRVIRCAIF